MLSQLTYNVNVSPAPCPQPTECDLERLRSELEEGLTVWTGAAALDRDEVRGLAGRS